MNSSTAGKVAGMPAEIDEKKLEVDISELAIEKIKLRNNTLSIIMNVGVPVVVAGVTFMALVLHQLDEAWENDPGMELEW